MNDTDQNGNMHRLLCSIAIGILFTTYYIQSVIYFGKYAYPIGPDDITYINDALIRLSTWKGGISFLHQHIAWSPHSPVYSYLAIAGFSLFGLHDWAPLAMTGLFIIFFNWAVLSAMKARPLLCGVLVLLVLLTCRFFTFCVTEYRPDMFTGLILGFGGILFLQRPWLEMPWKWWACAGGLYGLAILFKPAYIPASLALLLTGMGCAFLAGGIGSFFANLLPALRLVAVALLAMSAVASPHLVFAWKDIYTYIYDNMLGQHANMWYLGLSLKEQLLYYIKGQGGKTMLAPRPFVFFCICVYSGSILYAFRKKDYSWLKNFLAYSLYIVASYVVVSATRYMTPFLGAAFFGSVLVGTVFCASYVLKHCSKFIYRSALAALSIFVLCNIIILPSTGYRNPSGAHMYWNGLNVLLDDIFFYRQPDENMLFTTCEYNLAGITFTYELLKKYNQIVHVDDLHRETSTENALRRIDAVNIVVTVENPEQTPHLPSNAWLSDAQRYLDNHDQFVFIGRYPLTPGGMNALLYVKKDVTGLQGLPFGASNLGSVEGPYPQWNLPRIRWLKKTTSSLSFPRSPGKRRLVLEMRPAYPNMVIRFTLPNSESKEITLVSAQEFIREEFILDPSSKEEVFIMEIIEPPKEEIPNYIQFKSLLLVPEPLAGIGSLETHR